MYERNLFTKKNELFKADGFLDEVKCLYTEVINKLSSIWYNSQQMISIC